MHFHGGSQSLRYQDLPDPDKPSGILSSTEALQVLLGSSCRGDQGIRAGLGEAGQEQTTGKASLALEENKRP